MLARLFDYFGVLGVSSIVLWAVALIATVAFCFFRRWRVQGEAAAVAVALAGLVLATLNSENINLIEKEYFDPMAAMLPVKPGGDDKKEPEPGYEYRKAGKQARQVSDNKAAPPGDNAARPLENALPRPPLENRPSATGPDAPAKPPGARTLPEDKYNEANLLDELNLWMARRVFAVSILVLLVSIVLAALAWLRGQGTLGLWAPGKEAVAVAPLNLHVARQLLERVVKRGEAFIYLGSHDPNPFLERPAVEGGEVLFREVHLLRCGSPAELGGGDLLFEPVWYGFACLEVVHPEAARLAFQNLRTFLDGHRSARRAARRRINIVCHLQPLPPREELAELRELCRTTHCRLIVATPGPWPDELAGLVDEVFTPLPKNRAADEVAAAQSPGLA